MAAKNFTVQNVRTILTYLRLTDANSAFNLLHIQVDKELYIINGFIGSETTTSLSLKGGLSWTERGNLNSIVFELVPGKGKFLYVLNEKPVGMKDYQALKIIKSFINSVKTKVHDKMVIRNHRIKKPNGFYNGMRLEAHRRTSTLPSNKFAQNSHLFTAEFANLAEKMHVTYR